LGFVAAGGAAGAAARDAVEQALPTAAHGFPVATLLINLSGAFALGLLIEALVRAGPETPRRRRTRLVLGTGFLGAFTTYSTFAVEADLLVRDGDAWRALAYVAATVLGGAAATFAGVVASAPLGRRRRSASMRHLPLDPDVDASS
jgi:CrcB protein